MSQSVFQLVVSSHTATVHKNISPTLLLQMNSMSGDSTLTVFWDEESVTGLLYRFDSTPAEGVHFLKSMDDL
jgi:hypothetical protein